MWNVMRKSTLTLRNFEFCIPLSSMSLRSKNQQIILYEEEQILAKIES